jgi:hypothetical protein
MRHFFFSLERTLSLGGHKRRQIEKMCHMAAHWRGTMALHVWLSLALVKCSSTTLGAQKNDGNTSTCHMWEPPEGWRGVQRLMESDTTDVARKLQCYCMRRKADCAHLRLEKGELTVLQLYVGFQTRIRSTLFTLYDALARSPALQHMRAPVEWVIELSDGQAGCDGLPVFMMTTRNAECITVPDFTFGSWPESICPPGDESHSWRSLYDQMPQYAAEPKRNGLVWSGANTGRIRTKFLHLYPSIRAALRDSSQRFTFQITEWTQNKGLKDNTAHNCLSLSEACRYRYQLYLPGATYSSNLKYKLMCKAVVMAAFDEWTEWWYQALKDEENVVRLRPEHEKDAP